MHNHPLLVWRLRNTSGVALEQGPITVRVDEQYRGEGLMRFTGVDDDVQIAYVLEFGVLVSEEREYPPRQIQGVVFNPTSRQAEVTWYYIKQTNYTLQSNVQRIIDVVIEQRDPPAGDFFDMPAPLERLEGHTRWAIELAGHARATFRVQERAPRTDSVTITSWRMEDVQELQAAGALTDAQVTTCLLYTSRCV